MKECEVASWWWASNLSPAVAPAISNGQIVTFQKCLQDILEHKYESHWYIRDPERGSGFRSIMFEGHSVDGVLLQAARNSGIQNLKQRLTTQCIMWVDPGAVKVVYSHSPKKQHVLYQAAPTSANGNNAQIRDVDSDNVLLSSAGSVDNAHSNNALWSRPQFHQPTYNFEDVTVNVQ